MDQEAIERIEASGTQVFAPVPCAEKLAGQGKDPYARRPEDTTASPRGGSGWERQKGGRNIRIGLRRRSGSTPRHEITVSRQFLVRGIDKVLSSTFWYALTHNFERHKAWMQPQKA